MNPNGGGLSKFWFLLPFFIIFIPLVWIRKTEKLAFTHLISDAIIVFVIITVCVYGGMAVTSREKDEGLPSMYYVGAGGFGIGISSSVYAFEGIACVLPVREIVADKKGFYKLLFCVVMGIGIFYIAFSQYCLWTYGPAAIEADTYVTAAMPPSTFFSYAAKLTFCLSLVFTYPL